MCLLGTHVYRLECIPEWVLLVAGMLVDMLVEVVVVCMSFVVLFVGGVLRNYCRTCFPLLSYYHNYYRMAFLDSSHIAVLHFIKGLDKSGIFLTAITIPSLILLYPSEFTPTIWAKNLIGGKLLSLFHYFLEFFWIH